MIEVTAKMRFQSSIYGNIDPGDKFKCTVADARQFKQHDMIEEVEIDPMGKPLQSSSLQAAPASPEIKPNTLERSENKDDAKSSESTPAIKQPSATLSTDATEDGGKSTTRKRQRKPRSGPKTSGRQKS